MQGTILKSLASVKSTDCAVVCISDPNCVLVNYKKDETLCELISDSQTQEIANNLWNVLRTDTTTQIVSDFRFSLFNR